MSKLRLHEALDIFSDHVEEIKTGAQENKEWLLENPRPQLKNKSFAQYNRELAWYKHNVSDRVKVYDKVIAACDRKLGNVPENSITDDQIQRARDYPITDLIESKRNMAKCPFHYDKTASLNLKNNYWHCHAGCGSGDTIALLMKRDGLSFKEAVLQLN